MRQKVYNFFIVSTASFFRVFGYHLFPLRFCRVFWSPAQFFRGGYSGKLTIILKDGGLYPGGLRPEAGRFGYPRFQKLRFFVCFIVPSPVLLLSSPSKKICQTSPWSFYFPRQFSAKPLPSPEIKRTPHTQSCKSGCDLPQDLHHLPPQNNQHFLSHSSGLCSAGTCL